MNLLSPRAARTSLAQLFIGPKRPKEVTRITLRGGETLYEPGDPADQLYFLTAGRLAVILGRGGPDARVLGIIRPGEPAGEMAMLGGSPHIATVVALRDSEVLSLPRADFLRAVQKAPLVMTEIASLMVRRARGTGENQSSDPTVFGFVGACGRVHVRELAEQLAVMIRRANLTVAVVGREAAEAAPDWFTHLEEDHDLVLFAAEHADEAWIPVLVRQVDHLFRVGDGSGPPPVGASSPGSQNLQREGLVDLILLHRPGSGGPSGSAAWLIGGQVARLFHMREGETADLERMARVVTGRSVGLVLSGGGARAYTHIGAVRALHEARAPIDFVCGVSMGAIVGAGVAAGWDDEEMDRRIRRAFVDSSPVADVALPLIAMTGGRKVDERLAEHFGDLEIPDLGLPFFCLSSDLTEGACRTHRTGRVRDALRASVSLPGVLPPVVDGGHVLVDGAVTGNFPTELMRAEHRGPVIGCDVSLASGVDSDDLELPGLWRWILSGAWRRGPPIVSILMRSATIRSEQEIKSSREAADLVITPQIDDIEIRDWKAYDAAVQAGYEATVAALAGLERPLTELRTVQPGLGPEMEEISSD